jgi:hypothetical protein
MTDFTEPASVQYNDYLGTVAGDVVDFHHLEDLVAPEGEFRVLAVELGFWGGTQYLTAFGVKRDVTFDDLDELVRQGEPIRLERVATFETHLPGHSDLNPPAPPRVPITSATDFLLYGWKRLNIRLLRRSGIPEDAEVVADWSD